MFKAASLVFSDSELRNGDLEERRDKEEEKVFSVFFAGPSSDPNNNVHPR